MLLTHALLKSQHGIAIRRQAIANKQKGSKVQTVFAMSSDRGIVWIFNCRNATVRRLEPTDQLRNDWEPVEPKAVVDRRIKKDQLQENPVELKLEKPKPVKVPKEPKEGFTKSAPVKIEGPNYKNVCARCEEASEIKTYISPKKWLCPNCLPPR